MQADRKTLRYELLKEIDRIILMTPIWAASVQRAKLAYERTQSGEDFVAFLEAFYQAFYMKERAAWISRLLREVPE